MGYKFEKYSIGGGGVGEYVCMECYWRYSTSASGYYTLETLFIANGYTPAITYYVVDTLPESPNVTDMTTANPCHIYIYNNIGYLYGNLGYGNMWVTVADVLTATSGQTITNIGFTSDITAETEKGVYVTYQTVSKETVEGLNAKVETLRGENATLEAENATLEAENATVAEKTASANFTEYAVLEGSTDGVAITDITDTTIECITISNSVTGIENSAFEGCTGLTSITIPDSVTSIGEEAFRSCTKLTSITIPDSVTSIGDFAFFGCYHLTSITIPDSVTSIGEAVVISCNRLESATIGNGITNIPSRMFSGCTGLASVIIPSGVTNIGMSSFVNCTNLPTVTIPNGVISIEKWAFWGCAGLTSIIYNGTKAQWKAITFGEEWDLNTPDYIITCTDGTIAKDGTET